MIGGGKVVPGKVIENFNDDEGRVEISEDEVTATTPAVAGSRRIVRAGKSAPSPKDISVLRSSEPEMRGTVDIAKGIEALEAVAAAAAVGRISAGRLSPASSGGHSVGSAGRKELPPPPSEPAYWRTSSKRGMAALDVAGSRRSWVWPTPPASRSATPDSRGKERSASIRISNDCSPTSDRGEDEKGVANRSGEKGKRGIFVARAPHCQESEKIGNAKDCGEAEISSSSTNSSSSERFARARDSIGVAVRRSVNRGSIDGGVSGGGSGGSNEVGGGANATFGGNDKNNSISSSQRPFYPTRTRRASSPMPNARGFSAITFHHSLARQEGEATRAPTNGTPGGSGAETTNGRMKARGWRMLESARGIGADGSRKGNRVGFGGGGSRGGSRDKEVSAGKGTNTSPGAIRAENAELRLARRRLEEALTAAKEKAGAAEERSKELARQAASRVRQAEVQRASAEEAARGAEAKAYSLSATVKVLQTTADYGRARSNSSEEGSLASRVVEAEVTAAYQTILQDMDMERAALQQQLAEVQRENDMLRSRAIGPQTHTFSSPPGSRDASPLPTPRSFGRPKARGFSAATHRDLGGARDAGSPDRRSGRGRRDHGRPFSGRVGRLEEVLGTRVRLVQLEGLDEMAARANEADDNPPAGQPSRLSRAEELRVAEPSAEAPPFLAARGRGRGARDAFPWSKEFALWYGPVALIVAPSTGATKDLSKAPAHAILLTHAALYVIETPPLGARRGGGGKTGSDSLCRIERRRVESLSLPLETRALPSGDEVAVRSSAVVVRLRLLRDGQRRRHDSEGERIGAAAGVERGYLWLSCENNEARGDLVEHLCEWYQNWHGQGPRAGEPNDGFVDSSIPNAAVAAAAAAAAVMAAAATGGSFSSSEAANGSGHEAEDDDDNDQDDDDDQEEALEVEQILMKDLVEELGEQRSLNVTALLLVDKDTLAPVNGQR